MRDLTLSFDRSIDYFDSISRTADNAQYAVRLHVDFRSFAKRSFCRPNSGTSQRVHKLECINCTCRNRVQWILCAEIVPQFIYLRDFKMFVIIMMRLFAGIFDTRMTLTMVRPPPTTMTVIVQALHVFSEWLAAAQQTHHRADTGPCAMCTHSPTDFRQKWD